MTRFWHILGVDCRFEHFYEAFYSYKIKLVDCRHKDDIHCAYSTTLCRTGCKAILIIYCVIQTGKPTIDKHMINTQLR